MDGRRLDAVTDESLDREIESLLAVEPSPDFLARVRARIAEEEPHGSWVGWHLGVAVASLAIAVTVACAMWLSKDGASPASEQARATVSEHIPPQPRAVEPSRIASAPVAMSPRPRSTRPAQPAPNVVASERLVPVVNEEDRKAFDAFLATIRGSRVVMTFDESRDSALAGSPLVIDPIAIDPLPDVLEGGVE